MQAGHLKHLNTDHWLSSNEIALDDHEQTLR
jgi:hypothetical protein